MWITTRYVWFMNSTHALIILKKKNLIISLMKRKIKNNNHYSDSLVGLRIICRNGDISIFLFVELIFISIVLSFTLLVLLEKTTCAFHVRMARYLSCSWCKPFFASQSRSRMAIIDGINFHPIEGKTFYSFSKFIYWFNFNIRSLVRYLFITSFYHVLFI